MDPLQKLQAEYGFTPGGTPAPLNPAQSRLVPPTPAARGPTQVTPAPTPVTPPPGGAPGGGLTSKMGRMPGNLTGYDRYERGPGGVGWMDIQTGRPVTDKKLLAVLNGQDPSTVGGGGGVASAGSIPKLYTEPDIHGRTMKAYEEYTLPSGVTVIPEPKVNKYGVTYDLKVTDKPKPGPNKPGDERVRDVNGVKVYERVDEKGLWVPDPKHAQPPRGKYPPNSVLEIEAGKNADGTPNMRTFRTDAEGTPHLIDKHGQPLSGNYKEGQRVVLDGKLWIGTATGHLAPAPPHMQPLPSADTPSTVRPGTRLTEEEARAEQVKYRLGRIEKDQEYMAKRAEEYSQIQSRRVSLDYLHGLMESGKTPTGPLADWWLPLGEAAIRLGIVGRDTDTADKIGYLRTFDAISKQLQQQMRIAGTGAISDKDMVLFGRMIPTTSNDYEGNRKMIAALRQMDDYQQRVYAARQEYYDEHHNLEGWEKYRKSRPELARVFRTVKTGSPEWEALGEGEMYVDVDAKGKEHFYLKKILPQ